MSDKKLPDDLVEVCNNPSCNEVVGRDHGHAREWEGPRTKEATCGLHGPSQQCQYCELLEAPKANDVSELYIGKDVKVNGRPGIVTKVDTNSPLPVRVLHPDGFESSYPLESCTRQDTKQTTLFETGDIVTERQEVLEAFRKIMSLTGHDSPIYVIASEMAAMLVAFEPRTSEQRTKDVHPPFSCEEAHTVINELDAKLTSQRTNEMCPGCNGTGWSVAEPTKSCPRLCGEPLQRPSNTPLKAGDVVTFGHARGVVLPFEPGPCPNDVRDHFYSENVLGHAPDGTPTPEMQRTKEASTTEESWTRYATSLGPCPNEASPYSPFARPGEGFHRVSEPDMTYLRSNEATPDDLSWFSERLVRYRAWAALNLIGLPTDRRCVDLLADVLDEEVALHQRTDSAALTGSEIAEKFGFKPHAESGASQVRGVMEPVKTDPNKK